MVWSSCFFKKPQRFAISKIILKQNYNSFKVVVVKDPVDYMDNDNLPLFKVKQQLTPYKVTLRMGETPSCSCVYSFCRRTCPHVATLFTLIGMTVQEWTLQTANRKAYDVAGDIIMPLVNRLKAGPTAGIVGLTERVDGSCCFCLDDSVYLSESVHCRRCSFMVHEHCWARWTITRVSQVMACPLCTMPISEPSVFEKKWNRSTGGWDVMFYQSPM